jgi:hypothetical protein
MPIRASMHGIHAKAFLESELSMAGRSSKHIHFDVQHGAGASTNIVGSLPCGFLAAIFVSHRGMAASGNTSFACYTSV